jgi:DNA-binding transcriptional regulator YdaS (Cro superfamily)
MDLTGMALLRSQRGLMTRIAAELGIERGAVAMWKKIPPERVPDVERITGIPRHELRPDLWEKPAAAASVAA